MYKPWVKLWCKNSIFLHLTEANLLITISALTSISLWMWRMPRSDSLSPFIVLLMYDLIRRIELKERSQDADVAGIVSKTDNALWIPGYAALCVLSSRDWRVDGLGLPSSWLHSRKENFLFPRRQINAKDTLDSIKQLEPPFLFYSIFGTFENVIFLSNL